MNDYGKIRDLMHSIQENTGESASLIFEAARDYQKSHSHFNLVDCLECALDDYERALDDDETGGDPNAEHRTFGIKGIDL